MWKKKLHGKITLWPKPGLSGSSHVLAASGNWPAFPDGNQEPPSLFQWGRCVPLRHSEYFESMLQDWGSPPPPSPPQLRKQAGAHSRTAVIPKHLECQCATDEGAWALLLSLELGRGARVVTIGRHHKWYSFTHILPLSSWNSGWLQFGAADHLSSHEALWVPEMCRVTTRMIPPSPAPLFQAWEEYWNSSSSSSSLGQVNRWTIEYWTMLINQSSKSILLKSVAAFF